MSKTQKLGLLMVALLTMGGCSTINSIPYKASTSNVISLQNTFKNTNTQVALGSFALAQGINEELMCRMLGPVKVAPGKSLSTFIKEAFQEELFLAQAYDPKAQVLLDGRIERLSFSSVSPAHWDIGMKISSNKSSGYSVSVKYSFDSSFDAWSACKNVADAFAPAVQELLRQVVTHPQFAQLAN